MARILVALAIPLIFVLADEYERHRNPNRRDFIGHLLGRQRWN